MKSFIFGLDFPHLLWYIVCYQAKEVTRKAKITIEELYRGEKYDAHKFK